MKLPQASCGARWQKTGKGLLKDCLHATVIKGKQGMNAVRLVAAARHTSDALHVGIRDIDWVVVHCSLLLLLWQVALSQAPGGHHGRDADRLRHGVQLPLARIHPRRVGGGEAGAYGIGLS